MKVFAIGRWRPAAIPTGGNWQTSEADNKGQTKQPLDHGRQSEQTLCAQAQIKMLVCWQDGIGGVLLIHILSEPRLTQLCVLKVHPCQDRLQAIALCCCPDLRSPENVQRP